MNVKILTYDEYLSVKEIILPALNDIYTSSFSLDFSSMIFDYLVVSSDNQYDLLQYPQFIEAMCSINNNSLWNICGSIEARSTGIVKRMLEKIVQDGMWLYVDFNNPYWARAIGLYTSLGFTKPQTVDNYVKLLFSKEKSDKNKQRKKCNKLRKRYYRKNGFYVYKTSISNQNLDFFQEISRRQGREYGGVLEIRDKKISGISKMYVGNYITEPHSAYVIHENKNHLCTFHTHPDATKHEIISPPSTGDFMFMLSGINDCVTKHYIFESINLGGFWVFQVNPFVRKFLKTLNSETFNQILENCANKIQEVIEMYFLNISMKVDYTDEYIKTTVLNKFLAEINNIKLSTFIPSNDFLQHMSLFFLDYIDWKFQETQRKYVDYIITDSEKCEETTDGLNLDQDLSGLYKILDAIDKNSEFYGQDIWKDKELIKVLKRTSNVDPEIIASEIVNYHL